MKYLVVGGALVGGILLGFRPGGLSYPKPRWWRWLAMLSLALLVFLSFWIPTGGTFGGAEMVIIGRGHEAASPVLVEVIEANEGRITGQDENEQKATIDISSLPEATRSELTPGTSVILQLSKSENGGYAALRVIRMNPSITLPLLPALEERARNLYFHVPSAWLAQLAWFIAFAYAILFLRKGRLEDDIKASSTAAVGALFCVLATVTGSIWAKFNWGSFWNWDPRQVSIFIVLAIYGAWFALRSAISSSEQRARVSSIYLVLLALPVTFFIFVYPRITAGLHPGAEGSPTVGPVIDPNEIWLNPTKQALFALGFFAFSLLFFWMVNLSVRSRMIDRKRVASSEHRKEAMPHKAPEIEAIGG
ncbi:MAG: cytochrome c biogenesis protein CcsA [Chlorobi bacterium]|nr:cytochrome c biogenesis protein CcsA [Chlorobiota bacterium]